VVSQCANPRCDEPFIYFRLGKLFAVPRRGGCVTPATIEYFWLCQRCAESLAFEFRQGEYHPALVSRHMGAGNRHPIEYKL
jgi:hypothetical protein